MLTKNLFYKNSSFQLILRLLILLLLYSISRLVFYFINTSIFSNIGFVELIKILFYGLRFDVSAILAINFLFIFLSLLPFKFRNKRAYQNLIEYLFYVVNSIGFVGNCADLIYFRFTLKRTTFDILEYVTYGNDFVSLLPQYLKDYWFIFIIWILLIVSMIYLYKRTKKIEKSTISKFKYFLVHSVVFIVFLCLTIIGIRGGLQLRPINIITAGQYTAARNVPLILNTPFTIIKTINKQALEPVAYFENQTTLDEIYSPVYNNENDSIDREFKDLNVVIIILESFSKEHIGGLNKGLENGNYKGFTPFFDSLMNKSLVFVNAFANGKKSMEGIPAVVAGFPTLMDNPYISSIYSGNKISSLASLLKEKDYSTSFYHGGTNGTMGFDDFTKMTGFDKYYGRFEYNNEKEFDGKWGIFDEEFFQYFANNLNKTKQPFFTTIFSLSSHHPYTIPEKHKGKFRKGNLSIQETIMYTDYSLKKFFETASKMTWFKNTLFVITADHSSLSYYPFYQNRLGTYAIPMLYYQPNSNLIGYEKRITQQIDIMPTVLNYLNYDKNYVAFGSDAFDSTASNFSITYLNDVYQLIKDDYMMQFDGENVLALYDIKSDSLLQNNLVNKIKSKNNDLEKFVKAVIQSYNKRMIENDLIGK